MPTRYLDISLLEQVTALKVTDDPGYIHEKKSIPNACQVVLYWVMANGKLAHNVLYCNWTGSPALSTAIANNIMNTIKAAYTAALGLATFQAPATNFNAVSVMDFRVAGTGTLFFSDSVAAPGTSASPSMPDENAAVLTVKTANRGPSGRGRVYIPNFATNAIAAGGIIAPTCITALNNFATNGIMAGLATLGTPSLGLTHRAAYKSPVTGADFPDRPARLVPITQMVSRDNHWDSQRKRGLK